MFTVAFDVSFIAIEKYFSSFTTKIFIVGTHQKPLGEALNEEKEL